MKGVISCVVMLLVFGAQGALACDDQIKAKVDKAAVMSEVKAASAFGSQDSAVRSVAIGSVRETAASAELDQPYELGDLDVFEFSFTNK